MSSAPCATLETASNSGTSAGSASRAILVRTGLVGHDEHGLEAVGRVEPHRLAVGADDEPAEQRRGDVVGVAFELGRDVQQVGVELEQVVGGDEPGDVGGGARAQPAAERDAGA